MVKTENSVTAIKNRLLLLKIDYITRDPPHDSEKNLIQSNRRFCVSVLSSQPENQAKKEKFAGLGI